MIRLSCCSSGYHQALRIPGAPRSDRTVRGSNRLRMWRRKSFSYRDLTRDLVSFLRKTWAARPPHTDRVSRFVAGNLPVYPGTQAYEPNGEQGKQDRIGHMK